MEFITILATHFGLNGQAAVLLIIGALLALGFVRSINGSDNPIEFWHFFASYNEHTHEERGDVNSLGMVAGIVASLFTIIWSAYKAVDQIDPWVLGVCLVYLGGVKAFAAWLRTVAAKRYGVPTTDAELPTITTRKREITRSTSDKTTTQEDPA